MNQLLLGRAAAVWPLLIAQILIFGTAAFALFVATSPDSQPHGVARSLTPLWRWLALVALLAAPLTLLLATANMAAVPICSAIPLMPEVVAETHFGCVWSCDFVTVAVLAAVAWWAGCRQASTVAIALLSAAMLAWTSLSSHAIDRGTLALVIYFIHEAAAALWIGAILGLWIGATRARFDSMWIEATAPRVSWLAGWTVVVLILSGLYTAYYSLARNPAKILHSTYGHVLLIKVGAAAVVLLIGAYNRFLIIPELTQSSRRHALLRNIGLESLMLIGVLGLAALLANTPPVH